MKPSVKVSRILHAGYIFESEGSKICFDPIFENPFSGNCQAFPDIRFDQDRIRQEHFDAVFISHFHDDHCSLESLRLLNRETPIYLYCVFEELFQMIQALGFKNVIPLRIDQTEHVGPFKVTPRRALDAEVDSIFRVQVHGINILNVVDSWIDPEMLKIFENEKPWDLILWPFQTMRELEVLSPLRAEPVSEKWPEEWSEQLRVLEPRYLVPSSCQFRMEEWSWYNRAFFPISYQGFTEQVADLIPNTKVIRLNPARSILFEEDQLRPAESLEWITPIGNQDVDYEYQPGLPAPTTLEIATKLPRLSDIDLAKVRSYCRTDLPAKYQSLEEGEGYFSQERYWQLTIYDGDGSSESFYYRIVGQQMEAVEPGKIKPAWTTELPAIKLFGALWEGESLTSMYVRINDRKFDSRIEVELQEADLMEDPLLRCLFSGNFGGYQAAQLKRILHG